MQKVFYGVSHLGQVAHVASLLVVPGQLCAPGQIGLQDFLVRISLEGINLYLCLAIAILSFFFYLFLRIIYQTFQKSIWL